MNASDTRRGIAKAFAMWSNVSPFSFREVPADEEADIKIGLSIYLSYSQSHTNIYKKLRSLTQGLNTQRCLNFFVIMTYDL